MASSFALRAQIEAALAEKIPCALTPMPRMARPVVATGVCEVDEAVGGGLPVGAVTEMVGAECSGRTSLALSFVTQVMREGKVCAWVDVSDALSPESAAACGVDLARLLWVRCGVICKPTSQMRDVGHPGSGRNGFAVPKKYFVAKPGVKGLHGGGMGGHPRGEAKGMSEAVGGLLGQAFAARCAEPQRKIREVRQAFEPLAGCRGSRPSTKFAGPMRPMAKPWRQIEQALKATDLLLQAGGFGAIVLDMGGLAAEHVSRIPLATWFRYRAAAERTHASVLLLTQYACAKSAAGLVLRMVGGDAVSAGATVLTGFERSVEVARQRFAGSEQTEKVVSIRKPPQRVGTVRWRSGTAWAGR